VPTLVPDLVWVQGGFRRGLGIEFSASTGRIQRIASPAELASVSTPDSAPLLRLADRALLPGFVNAHSHAFQRVIRGRGQWRPAEDVKSDFWTWRRAMYDAALTLSPEEIFDVSRFCFLEMLCAGYTTVGEFHYLHRDASGAPYASPSELAHRVIAAAEEVGIRIVLLNVAYVTGGIGQALQPQQQRFATPDLDSYLAETSALADFARTHPLVTIGVAPHSLRAVPREWLQPSNALSRRLNAPFHMHVSEQPAEVTAVLEAWGRRPVEVLAENGVIDDHLTAVHATHLTFREVELLGTPGPTICACPTTERDLGDGFLPGKELLEAGARIALGTDSQTMIDPLGEMRLLEYHERLRRLRRVVIAANDRDRLAVAPALLAMGTECGARSLRLHAGRVETGALADFVAIDLEHRALEGWSDDTLGAFLALCAPADVVSDVWVNGVQRVQGGHHRLDRESAAAFRAVARRLSP
jgi:formimidoylglutamate deiminase